MPAAMATGAYKGTIISTIVDANSRRRAVSEPIKAQ